jgi:Zn-dependent M28 family amino/carboxypeptidase
MTTLSRPGARAASLYLAALVFAAAAAAPLAAAPGTRPGVSKGKPLLAPAPGLSAEEAQAAEALTEAQLRAHVRFLASDLLEGRRPGTRGSQLAIAYLAAQLEALGLQPGAAGADGKPSFLQTVPLVELQAQVPAAVTFEPLAGGAPLQLSTKGGAQAELVLDAASAAPPPPSGPAELVFAGYGIVAPEYGWDDYAGKDVRGKIVVLLNFNPPFAGEVNGRRVRLWYGRWDYKFLTAKAHGAAGALIVHTEESAGYPWQVLASSASGDRFDLPQPEGAQQMAFQGWLEEAAARRLFALGGQDLGALTAAAQQRGFAPVSLGVKSRLSLPVKAVQLESANVVGRLPGSDPLLAQEAVVYTAHHDHLGALPEAEGERGKDRVYNGAVDNASGCATVLAIAKALAATHPRRSILFVFTTAEEQGLLGARWFAQHPPLPAGRIAAGINLDSIHIFGKTREVGLLGLGKSTLDATLRTLAALQGRPVHGDAFPDHGSFYRSDQFELARIGVPVAHLKGGPELAGKPDGAGTLAMDAWRKQHYHQPSDELSEAWDLSGAIQDAQLQLWLGLRVANAQALPQWTPGDEFEAARRAAPR